MRTRIRNDQTYLPIAHPDSKNSRPLAAICQNLNYANVGKQQCLVTKAIDIL
ncbi:hypothetical protein [Microcoleus sp. Aus8_D4]|uniref:hypothetical protein n=1 Tax=Microcoleus sp. Aus8_D4 TaxID=2818634 RepID=UPI002FD1D93D